VIVACCLPAAAQQRIWTVTGDPVEGWEYVDDGVEEFMQDWAVPGAALSVALEGRLVFSRGYTWDAHQDEIVQPDSLFRIASMSKPITSVAIHQLIERGELSYDTLVVDILDLEPPQGQPKDPRLDRVTVDHLLYHTGGWDRDTTFDPMFHDSVIAAAIGVDLPISKHDVATYMTGQPMQFEPGSRYAYSNYGYCLLGLIIEQVTGRDYSEWVAENVFQPIGVGRPRRGHSAIFNRAPGEVRYYGVPGDETQYVQNVENMDSHGGWIMAAPDYLRFLSELFDDMDNSPLLSRQSIENMVRTNDATSIYYGRGWVVTNENGRRVYGHQGSLSGTITTGRWTEPGIAMAAFINTRKIMDDFELEDPTVIPDHDLFASLGIADDGLGAALAESWIPVVASGGGAGTSVWQSDVALLNRSPGTNLVKLRVEKPGLAVDHELELAPGEQTVVNDIVSELGLTGSGSLSVFSYQPLTVASRTYNTSVDGTFGQFLGGVTGPGGLGNGETAVLMHLREDDAARSNLGILNGGRRQARVEIVLKDESGAEVARVVRGIATRQIRQLNQPFADLAGRTDIASGYAEVTVLEGEEVVVYGSVVDNRTNDPTTIPMKTGHGEANLVVSAAARGEGVEGSVWRTDLGLLNIGDATSDIRVVFHPADGPDVDLQLDLAPGEHRVLGDVVGLLDSSGSGSLEITSSMPILVSSRTYNQGDAGTFGQYLDGTGQRSTVSAGGRVWLPQLQQNDGFRTNIGLHNTGAGELRARLSLADSDGSILSRVQRTIAAGGRVQLQEPFDRIAGRTDIDAGYVVVEVLEGNGLIAYASVIDNRTNDPTTVPMVR
jgi:CubicO group peptidase (beta-lactamase class C family)